MLNSKPIAWTLVSIFLIASIIDFKDDNLPKFVGTGALTIGLLMIAISIGRENKKMFHRIAIVLLLVALSSFLYRLITFYQ